MNEKISVIVPVYNGEKTICKCVDSILNQTHENLQVIVVDDGSTDKTIEILNRYEDSRLIVVSQKNMGQGMARNRAVSMATGDYIGFVDSDDYIDRSMYEVMLSKAVEYGADVVQCNIFDVYDNGEKIIQLPSVDMVVDYRGEKNYFKKYVGEHIHSFEVCNKLFRSEFLKSNNLCFKDTKKIHSEDLLFNFEMILKLNRIVFIKTPYYYYYQNQNSHSKKVSCDSIFRLNTLFCQFLSELDNENKYIKNQVCSIAVQVLLTGIAGLLKKTGERYFNEILKFICSSDVRMFLWGSMMDSEKLAHKALMLALIILPADFKLKIVKWHYSY